VSIINENKLGVNSNDNEFYINVIFNTHSYAFHENLGIDSRASAKKRKRQRNRDIQREFDTINDPDLKRELGSGQTQLITYSES
jgi:hypothetical protein